jgi:uncharacterized protein YbjT (DUF2867 family)
MKPTLVIGATGRVGREVVSQLTAKQVQVRAVTRNPDEAHLPPGVEVVRADLNLPETLDPCLDGIDTVFLVWTAPQSAVDAALERILKRAHRIVFLSAPLKTPHPFFQQPNPSRELALSIESRIEMSGFEWTFLRAGMFAANARHFWGPQIRAGDLVRWPYLDAATAPIDERDIAAVAVRSLTEEGHGGQEYVVTGPQSLSQYEQVSTIGEVIGRRLRIEEMPAEDARREWAASMPASVINMLLDAWAAAVGQPAWVTRTVEEITGTPARTFAEWIRNNASAFRGMTGDLTA